MNRVLFRCILSTLFLFWLTLAAVYAQPTEFTYQGRLLFGDTPANGSHDFEFVLWDAASAGNQIGSPFSLTQVNVNNGVFSVRLDFGNVFPGPNRFLEIRVRQSDTGAPFSPLSPRQAITSAPYSIKSLNAETAVNATSAANAGRLGGLAPNQYVITTDARLSDARSPLPNSHNYIQNTTGPQLLASFNISGSGVIGGSLTAGVLNGNGSGLTNLNAANISAGMLADTRLSANVATLSGTQTFTGAKTFSGGLNGSGAGLTNLNASNIASGTLDSLRLGIVPVGKGGTGLNAPGSSGNVLRSNGSSWVSSPLAAADIPSGSTSYIQNATAQQAGTANFNISGNGTVGGTLTGGIVNAATQYNLNGVRVFKTDQGAALTFVGFESGLNNSGGTENAFFGDSAGQNNTTGDFNTFLGEGAGSVNMAGSNNTAVGSRANFAGTGLDFATAIGADSLVTTSNTVMLGRFDDKVIAAGRMRVTSIPLEASAASVCFNSAGDLLRCGASSLRFKSDVRAFTGGLGIVRRLRPISFTWKGDGLRDLGLAAEEVAAIEPLLSIQNDRGEVEGVKYERVGIFLINAVQEQQLQIESQQRKIEAQQKEIDEQSATVKRQQVEIDGLKKFICSQNPRAELCRPNN